MLGSEQLAAREYWQPLEHPELATTISYPGAFAKFGETPIRYRLRPPLIGEHNLAIYGDELGLSESEIDLLDKRGVI